MLTIERSIPALFRKQAAVYGPKACVSFRVNGQYRDLSWTALQEEIDALSGYLIAQGIQPGDKIAVFSQNCYQWWAADQAILSVGAVSVPVYATNSAEEARYILDHSASVICFTGTGEHTEKVLEVKKQLPRLTSVISFTEEKQQGILNYHTIAAAGATADIKEKIQKRIESIAPNDLATIIYTSGTTGNPKGVMLSHKNILSNVEQVMHFYSAYVTEHDTFLSFLPLSHTLERTAGYYLPVRAGSKVAFAGSFATIQADMKDVRPTIIISVPRLYEKIHAGIIATLSKASIIKKLMFALAVKISARNLPYMCAGRERKGIFALLFNIAEKMVFRKIKHALGFDRITFAVSGGGPLSISDAEFFIGMGIQILEGFGMTETSPVTNVNKVGEIQIGSVGKSLIETEVTISDEGELLIKGPQVMLGYYNNPEATKEAFTKDGFLKTGDIGIIDSKGNLFITGRIKDILVTSGGKNISPQNIENSIKQSRYIAQIAIFGDKRKYLSALIIPEFGETAKWAAENNIPFSNNSDLCSSSAVFDLIASEIFKYTKDYARVEQIKAFKLLDAEWTQETGELTPSLKIKRKVIAEKYAADIEEIYNRKAE